MTENQVKKVAKTTLYVGVSAALGYLIAWTSGHADLFGVYAPLVNVSLVTLKQLFTTDADNV
ncbi:hypothetical protein CQ476_01 [TM7 phage DolZOral124_53_65]|nr:hypothetical protein CQ476_01 [TM7 phage DolZOral124_53_65]